MKVIFLDVDGVLNSWPDCKQAHYKMKVGGNGCIGISNVRLRFLKQIVDATDAKIVLVSSWKAEWLKYRAQVKEYLTTDMKEPLYIYFVRNEYGYYLHKKFRRHKLEVYDTTDDYEPNPSCRGQGIHNYLDAHKDITNWVVLDDDIFRDYDKEIMDHLINTNIYEGALDEEDVKKAIEILNQ